MALGRAARGRARRRAARSSSCRRPASSTARWPSTSEGSIAQAERRRRRGGRDQAQHARRLARRDERHRRHAARGDGPGHRLGRAGGRLRRERRHVHHPGRATSRSWRRARASARRRRSAARATDIEGTLGEKVKNDAIAKITGDRRGARPERRLGGLDGRATRRSSPAERGGRGRRRRRDRGDARRGPRVRRTARPSRSAGSRSRSTSPERDRPSRAMNPFQRVHPPAGRPDDRVPAVQHRLGGPAGRALQPELRDRHPRRALAILLAFIGLGSAAAQRRRAAADRASACVLFGLELTVTSHGLLGVGGLVCFALGASALFTGPGDPFEPRRPGRACRSSSS